VVATPSPGGRLGPYETLSLIGSGAMGEVWKANDTRLNRVVAIKVLKREFNERFEREARAIAALNHPNICTLFDVGPDYLVMEFVDGPTLAEKIAQGQISLNQAIAIAKQLAKALEAAHEKGIIHRDLKPANIKLTQVEGTVKVLDFGLAKEAPPNVTPGPDDETLPASVTRPGSIIGTPAYMSPEQARGEKADKRADIWAVGVMFYEMVTGKRPFSGTSGADLLAQIIGKEPDWVPVPKRVRGLIQRCLEKDSGERLRDIGELRIALNRPLESDEPARSHFKSITLPTAVLAAVIVTASVVAWRISSPSIPASAALLSMHPPPGLTFTEFGFASSPDGRSLAFVAGTETKQSIWIRPMDSLSARELTGTEGASYPFWSPDSKSLAFFSRGKLLRVEAADGVPRAICDAVNTRGGSWGTDGTIVFAPTAGAGLQRVSVDGGKPEFVTSLDPSRNETEHRWPRFLPGGKRFLYWVQAANLDDTGVYVASVDRLMKPVRIVTSGRFAEYAPPSNGGHGFLLWVRDASLLAQRFDPDRLRLEGEPIPISDVVGLGALGLAYFSPSDTGSLVYGSTAHGTRRMQWRGRDGRLIADVGPLDVYYMPRLSPDGTRVTVARVSTAVNSDVWVYEFERQIMTRLTDNPGVDNYPAWSPDGRQVAFTSGRGGTRSLFLSDAAGARREERLTDAASNQELLDWSSDNRYLLYREYDPVNHSDIFLLPMQATPSGRRAKPFLTTPFDETQAQFSPNAKWVVYVSNESGEYRTYVRAVSGEGELTPVSNQGAVSPRWRRDGKEILYVSSSGMLMGVEVSEIEGRLKISSPRQLFPIPNRANQTGIDYDVNADGTRFLVLARALESSAAQLNVALNWQSRFKE